MITGICILSSIPLRKEADNRSEIVSMVLFGETFNINQTENGWLNVKTLNDQYEGWISQKQALVLHSIPTSFTSVTQFPFAILQSSNGITMAPCGGQLPNYNGTTCQINDTVYTVTNAQTNFEKSGLVLIAKQYLNTPYLWGGRSPFGIDCSGFMQAVYKCIGIQLHRDAYQQSEMGTSVAFLEETKLGDLAFFDNEAGMITHVGMMLDNHTIIHASGKVRIDPIDSFGILNTDDKNYSHTLRLIRRIS